MNTYILIPMYNQSDVTIECLRSLCNINNYDFSVILGDNGSNRADQENIERFIAKAELPYKLTYFRNAENIGFGGINNAMVRSINDLDCFLFFLNNDTLVSPNCLEVLHSAFHAERNIGAVCPLITYANEPEIIWYGGGVVSLTKKSIFSHSYQNAFLRLAPAQQYTTQFCTGCAFYTTKEIFNSVHGFDDNYFLYFEDVDLSYAIKEKNLNLVVTPNTVVLHKVSSSTHSSGSEFSRYHLTRSRYYFYGKWFGFSAKALMAVKLALEICGFALKLHSSKERLLMRAFFKGLTEAGKRLNACGAGKAKKLLVGHRNLL